MIIMIKTDKQLKVPKWSKNEINRWADYIELRCLYMDDHLVSKDDVLDIFIDEDLDELQRGEAEHSLKYDKLSSVIGNYYEIIKYRKSKHPEYYPFDIEDDRCIVLKDNLENKHLHYIYLLLCSSLSFMDQSSMQKITHAFEKYCCPFMRLLVPVDARTELFGTTRDTNLFHGNLRSRIEQLAEFLGAQTTKTMDADKRYDRIKAGDAGLDILHWESWHTPDNSDYRIFPRFQLLVTKSAGIQLWHYYHSPFHRCRLMFQFLQQFLPSCLHPGICRTFHVPCTHTLSSSAMTALL